MYECVYGVAKFGLSALPPTAADTPPNSLGQNPGPVQAERVILDGLLDVNGNVFQIELNVDLDVGLDGYAEVPVVPLLMWITVEVREIVDWFVPALD